jgi:hypothetical protein
MLLDLRLFGLPHLYLVPAIVEKRKELRERFAD